MKIGLKSISNFLLVLFLFSQGDFRIKDQHMIFRDFLLKEQKSLRILESAGEQDKMLTGVQYAALQEYYKTIDPSELRVPLERLRPAVIETQRKKNSLSLKSSTGFLMDWEELDADMGGRVRALMWDPNDPELNKVWAAGVTGGLWYRENIFDDNSRWQVLDDFMQGLAIGCITYDPVKTETYYAGTGEGQTARVIYRESSGKGYGILKSENKGMTWDIIESTSGFAYVTDIEVRNENGNGVIYAGVVSGEYKSKIFQSDPDDGLYRSDNGGESWQQVLPNVPGTDHPFAPSDIEITANGRIFVGTGVSIDETGAGRILYSDNGFDWQVFDDYVDTILNSNDYIYPGRVMLASAPSDGNIIYAFLTAADDDFYSFKSPRGVYMIKSINGGLSWTEAQTPPPNRSGNWAYIAWHALASAVNPSNPDKIYAGGLDLHTSDNGSETWQHISSWYNFGNANPELPGYVHADQHTIKFRPGSSTDALFTSDGGVFLSRNADQVIPTFTEKNQGLNTLQYYTCAIHPERGKYFFLAGAQDNGTVVYRKLGTPVRVRDNVSYGDGTFCFIDKDNPDLQLTSSQFNYVYSTNVGLDYGFMENEIYYHQGGIFNNPMDYDSRMDILYCNTCDFYGRKADSIMRMFYFDGRAGATTLPLGTGTKVPFSAIKVSPYSDGTTKVFLGSQEGRLFKIENADYLFKNPNRFVISEIGSENFPAGNLVSIDVGASDDQLLVLFSNYGVPSVWETRDGGKTWIDKESNLPDMPVRWGIYHPVNKNQVLLATETGIWSTIKMDDEIVNWEPVGGFPNVRVDMVKVRESDYTVIAATHGRGLWISPQYPLYAEGDTNVQVELKIYPNPASQEVRISTGVFQGNNLDLYVFDTNGRQVYFSKGFIKTGEYSGTLKLSQFKKGHYFISLRNENTRINSSIQVMK